MAHVLAKDLRDAVLNAAFKGELSYQLSSDSDIEEYFTNVINEIKNSSNKKDETSALEDDELDDFPEIPNNWRYVRLNDLVSLEIRRGKSPKYDENGKALAFAQKCNSKYNGIQLQLARHISNESLKRYTENDCMKDCDIVVNSTGGGTLGRVGLYREDNNILNVPVYPDSHVTIIRAKKIVNSFYLYLYIKTLSPYLESLGEGSTNQTELKPKVLKDLIIPLPPIEEQQRIVDRVDELMAKIDEYEKLENQLVQLKEQFPKDMRDSLLQAGITGRLTTQSTKDTPVLQTLEAIKKDRDSRISQKQIKKDKRLDYVEFEDTRFDIPDSWKWTTLGAVLYKLTDGTHNTPKYTECGVKFVSVKDMSSGCLSLARTKYISEKEHLELFSRCNPEKGDILLSKVGTTGVPAIVDTDEKFSLFVSVALLKFNDALINREFLYRLLQSPDVQFQAAENTKGIGNKNWVLDKIANTEIPLPPIEEQQRIVDKLDEMLPLVDALAQMD